MGSRQEQRPLTPSSDSFRSGADQGTDPLKVCFSVDEDGNRIRIHGSQSTVAALQEQLRQTAQPTGSSQNPSPHQTQTYQQQHSQVASTQSTHQIVGLEIAHHEEQRRREKQQMWLDAARSEQKKLNQERELANRQKAERARLEQEIKECFIRLQQAELARLQVERVQRERAQLEEQMKMKMSELENQTRVYKEHKERKKVRERVPVEQARLHDNALRAQEQERRPTEEDKICAAQQKVAGQMAQAPEQKKHRYDSYQQDLNWAQQCYEQAKKKLATAEAALVWAQQQFNRAYQTASRAQESRKLSRRQMQPFLKEVVRTHQALNRARENVTTAERVLAEAVKELTFWLQVERNVKRHEAQIQSQAKQNIQQGEGNQNTQTFQASQQSTAASSQGRVEPLQPQQASERSSFHASPVSHAPQSQSIVQEPCRCPRHTVRSNTQVYSCTDCTEIFWIQLDDIDLMGFHRNLKYLLCEEDFLDDQLKRAAKYIVETFLPSFFNMTGVQRELPPANLMPAIQTLLSIYGRPLGIPEVEAPRPIDIVEPQSRPNRNSMQSNISQESEGPSQTFKKPFKDQKPENILVKWGQGRKALFREPEAVDEGDDVLSPGKTYPVCGKIESRSQGGEGSEGSESGVSGVLDQLRKRNKYRSPSVETVPDDGAS